MMKAPVKFGLFYFLTSTAIVLTLHAIDKSLIFNTWLNFVVSFGLAILFVVLAIREDRNNESGYSFAEGLKAGMITYGLGTLLSLIFTYILFNIIDPSLIDQSIEYAKEIAEKTASSAANIFNMPEESRERMLEELAKQEITNPFTPSKLMASWAIGMIFPGIIIVIITSVIMKKD